MSTLTNELCLEWSTAWYFILFIVVNNVSYCINIEVLFLCVH
jgi:hypothetical protein